MSRTVNGVEAMVAALNTKFTSTFAQQAWTSFNVAGQKAGQYKQAGTFSYVRIYGAGHEVPAYTYGESWSTYYTMTITEVECRFPQIRPGGFPDVLSNHERQLAVLDMSKCRMVVIQTIVFSTGLQSFARELIIKVNIYNAYADSQPP
jgi:hypothetical protein